MRVVYGGSESTAQIDQDLGRVPGGAKPNDGFGQSPATVDYDQDGYTDLVVSTPGVRWSAVVTAAAVPR